MTKEYKININGDDITYGALVTRSRFNEEEWQAIYTEMVKQGNPEAYEEYKDDENVIAWIGALIDLEDRYQALLELLPQDSYSKAGTHPQWVADEVNENTFDKIITQDDVKDMINDYEDIDDLKEALKEYFNIDMDYHGRCFH